MKKAVFGLLLTIWVVSAFGQPVKQSNYYDKAHTQRVFSVILTIGGAAMVAGSLLSMAAEEFSPLDGPPETIMLGSGFLLLAGGMHLSSKAKENIKKGNNITLTLKMESTSSFCSGVFVQTRYPSIQLSCQLTKIFGHEKSNH